MINVIIVEDNIVESKALQKHLAEYEKKNNIHFNVQKYFDAVSFLKEYKADADIVLMDINMPEVTGMEAAIELRKIDESAVLIFATDMVQYAVQGYSVNALDFILKPITYYALSTAIDKALKIINNRVDKELLLKNNGIVKRVQLADIIYIEVSRHRLIYHTTAGNYEGWGSLDSLEKSLPSDRFSRCNIAYLVGLKHVRTIEGSEAIVGGDRLKISRARKKDFLASVAEYLGKGG